MTEVGETIVRAVKRAGIHLLLQIAVIPLTFALTAVWLWLGLPLHLLIIGLLTVGTILVARKAILGIKRMRVDG